MLCYIASAFDVCKIIAPYSFESQSLLQGCENFWGRMPKLSIKKSFPVPKSTSPCLLAIPAFDPIAELYNRHFNSNREYAYTNA